MEGAWQAREPWRGLLTASLVLGLALYAFASTTQRPTTDSNNKSEADSGPPSQTQDAVRDMDPQTKAYHEGFMREAIAMVNHPPLQNCFGVLAPAAQCELPVLAPVM